MLIYENAIVITHHPALHDTLCQLHWMRNYIMIMNGQLGRIQSHHQGT